jgi:hypothetical protein
VMAARAAGGRVCAMAVPAVGVGAAVEEAHCALFATIGARAAGASRLGGCAASLCEDGPIVLRWRCCTKYLCAAMPLCL